MFLKSDVGTIFIKCPREIHQFCDQADHLNQVSKDFCPSLFEDFLARLNHKNSFVKALKHSNWLHIR